MVLNNGISGLRVSEDRIRYNGTETIMMPVEIRDINDEITDKHWKDYI